MERKEGAVTHSFNKMGGRSIQSGWSGLLEKKTQEVDENSSYSHWWVGGAIVA